MAINAIKTNTIAPILTASLIPSIVPLEIASSMFEPASYSEIFISLFISSFWGISILEIRIAPGAAITEAVNKCLAN